MPREPGRIGEVIYSRVNARKIRDEPGASCLKSKEILSERRRKDGRKGARGDGDGGIVSFF